MTFSNTQSTKNMSSRLLRIHKNNKIMSFSNTQLTKNMSSQLLRIHKNNIFKYAINKKYVITIIFMTS